jgi:hypothetical protein
MAMYKVGSAFCRHELEPFVVAEGEGGPKGKPFVIAADADPRSFIALSDRQTILLDLSLFLTSRSPMCD